MYRFQAYRQGEGVDGIAGAEALISHVITKKLGVPCAHAPAFAAMEAGECVRVYVCTVTSGFVVIHLPALTGI
jgi:hypothetical protein